MSTQTFTVGQRILCKCPVGCRYIEGHDLRLKLTSSKSHVYVSGEIKEVDPHSLLLDIGGNKVQRIYPLDLEIEILQKTKAAA